MNAMVKLLNITAVLTPNQLLFHEYRYSVTELIKSYCFGRHDGRLKKIPKSSINVVDVVVFESNHLEYRMWTFDDEESIEKAKAKLISVLQHQVDVLLENTNKMKTLVYAIA